MTAPDVIARLVERFSRNRDSYTGLHYKEAQLRAEFLDPFFEALGWDVTNRQGWAEAYKDVVQEDAVRVGGAMKAPDYAFRVGGVRKFFVEAKKPAVKIREDAEAAYQLRRYAWSAKLPLSILTNFDDLAVYDCRFKPAPGDKASAARVLLCSCSEYVARWDEIAAIFAHDSVLRGSFDKYAETSSAKRGTAEVDDAFLKQIEGWRDALAHNLALRNPDLTMRELNFAVQRTIDRLVFLRICEDRGIEEPNRLQGLLNAGHIYERLVELYREADARFNSGLFHFDVTQDLAEPADTLTAGLALDDRLLKEIIGGLYYPESPYVFSVFPADILGQVYEQFLGKVIRLTPGHQAKVEDKPEVKKAGGVFYTPTYIVDYIVRQTVGKLLEGKTPRQVAGAYNGQPLRVADPACGSGSFLIGAYQCLLDWHRDWYVANLVPLLAAGKAAASSEVRELLPVRSERGARSGRSEPRRRAGKDDDGALPVFQGPGGAWRLTTAERRRILLAHIFGVDLDDQAVEVTKMSLLLKVLEGENANTLSAQLSLFKERALPDLGDNIKCGNSLVGPDFYDNAQMGLLPSDEQYRVNAFDWRAGFPQVFSGPEPGFDAVIGNPPYIRIQTMKEWAPLEVEYYKKRYQAASKGNYDIYVVFVEKGLSLLNKQGRLGFILPHKFFNAQYGQPLREIISQGQHLSQVVHFGDLQVFENATTYTCLLFLTMKANDQARVAKVNDLETWRNSQQATIGMVACERITANDWQFNVGSDSRVYEKLDFMPLKLGSIAHLFVGLQTDADDVYILEEVRREDGKVLCRSKATGRSHWFEDDHLKPFLKGSLNIRRYHLENATKRLIFPYQMREGKSVLIEVSEYKARYPLTWAYLWDNRERLTARNKGQMGRDWYGYVYRKNHTLFGVRKLVVPSIATGSCFAADLDGQFFFVGSGGGGGGGYGIRLREQVPLSYYYVLGLLNSRLLSGYLRLISTPFRGGYIALNRQYIEQLPIRTIDFSDATDKARHDRMVALVERMLALHKQAAEARTDQEKALAQRQIELTDRQIDRLVYELYGLTEDEIAIVEGAR